MRWMMRCEPIAWNIFVSGTYSQTVLGDRFAERVRVAVAGENWRSMCAHKFRSPGRRRQALDRCKRLAEPGRTQCEMHGRIRRESNERRRVEAMLDGFCSRCLKYEARPGRKTCEVCAERKRR